MHVEASKTVGFIKIGSKYVEYLVKKLKDWNLYFFLKYENLREVGSSNREGWHMSLISS